MLILPELKEQPQMTGQLSAVRSPQARKGGQLKIHRWHQKHPFTASCGLYTQSSAHWLPCSCSFHPYNNREVLFKTLISWRKKQKEATLQLQGPCSIQLFPWHLSNGTWKQTQARTKEGNEEQTLHSQHSPIYFQPWEHGFPFTSVRTRH